MNVGGRGDREVGKALARLSSACGDGRLQSTPLPRDPIINGQRVGESRFDEPEPRSSQRAGLIIASDEQPEVQLRDRNSADRGLGLARNRVFADEH